MRMCVHVNYDNGGDAACHCACARASECECAAAFTATPLWRPRRKVSRTSYTTCVARSTEATATHCPTASLPRSSSIMAVASAAVAGPGAAAGASVGGDCSSNGNDADRDALRVRESWSRLPRPALSHTRPVALLAHPSAYRHSADQTGIGVNTAN
eukprot:GHVU01180401.1.p1 GENE.GHVU01180401.1~~GHVU01180401.1.p1  ORF type:complete len:156 (+),score=5.02 GHVU01180401.1:23-490(+)